MSRTLMVFMSLVVAVWAVCALGGDATAGTVGKVTGKVMDEKGGALPGANVVLAGTRRGATTDADGVYVILSIEPGSYEAKASMVGYHTITQEAVSVKADFTTTLDFKLREEALELEEMVVVAERPLVEPDKTESRYVVTAEDIENVPILRNVTDFIQMEAGVATDGSGAIRAGEVSDNAFFVDGIRIVNQDAVGHNVQNQWSGINTGAIQEISVITGGMNAEYGNAQAGVVHMVTRDALVRYTSEVEYRLTPASQKHWGVDAYEAPEHRGHMLWNDPAWVGEVDPATGRLVHQRVNYTDIRGHYVEGHLGGPLVPGAGFFVSSRYNKGVAALPNEYQTSPRNTRNTGKITVRLGDNATVKAGLIFDQWDTFTGGGQAGTSPSIDNVHRGTGRAIFLPEGSPAGSNRATETVIFGVFTHTVSPRTFYELRVSRYSSKREPRDAATTSDATIGTDKEGWFYTGWETIRNTLDVDNKRTALKADVSSQATKGHFVKAGLDLTMYSNSYTKEGYMPGDKRKNIYYIGNPEPGNPIEPKQIAGYVQDKMEFEGLIINAGFRYDRFSGVDVPALGGMRSWYKTMSRFLQAPRFPMKPIVNFSPRLGISHPITDKSAIHFFYGHYYQVPSFLYMFMDEWWATTDPPAGQWSAHNNTYRPSTTAIAWPIWDDTQRTINFEVGADWNIVSDYTVALATYYKSASFQQTGGGTGIFDPLSAGNPGTKLSYSSYSNNYNEDIRGFELSLRKGFSNYLSFRAAFNLEWAEFSPGGGGDIAVGDIAFPDSSYVASGKLFRWEVQNGVEVKVPLTAAEVSEIGHKANDILRLAEENPQNIVHGAAFPGTVRDLSTYDWLDSETKAAVQGLYMITQHQAGDRRYRGRRSQGSAQVFFSSPPEFGPGPRMMGGSLLGGINANLIYRLYVGGEFNYTNLQSQALRLRGPLHTVVDLNLQKRLRLGSLDADVFLEVYNLFDQKDANSSASEYGWWGLLSPYPDDDNYLTYGDFSDRSRYLGSPRVTHVGVRVKF